MTRSSARVAGKFWLSSEGAASGRSAIVADEGDSVWLYLTVAGRREIEADCWLFNCIDAFDSSEFRSRAAEYRERGEPPPATRDVVDTDSRLRDELDASRIRFLWSPDGEAVAAVIDGSIAGFIDANPQRGFSAHLIRNCPWGSPLEMNEFERLF
ncbi:MAG: hypothetical protein ABR582_07440 [Gemmatimonadaceae bacterium]